MVDENAVVAKVTKRIIPYIFICYIVNYLDRFNVSFAALEMQADLGFSPLVYGLGASMFFIGYVFFEIPSNLIMARVGPRIWIARIMITWGAVSTCMIFVNTSFGFYLLRFLLGVAEAGFFPGMIFYLTHWIPAKERARAFALFLTSTSLAGVFGGPISGALLKMGGVAGLKGWQWLFLVEGIPALVLGGVTLAYLSDYPDRAKWLSPAEREWLSDKMQKENEEKQQSHGFTLLRALTHPKVWRLCLLYFSIVISFYGVAFWLPQIVKSFSGLGNAMVGRVHFDGACRQPLGSQRRKTLACGAFGLCRLSWAGAKRLLSQEQFSPACFLLALSSGLGNLEHARPILEPAHSLLKRDSRSRRNRPGQFRR